MIHNIQFLGRNEYFSTLSLLSLCDGNNKEPKQHEMGARIDFEVVVTTTKRNLCNHIMV